VLRLDKIDLNQSDCPLQDFSLSIAAGEIYGLLGAAGAGKTTVIELACGLRQADRGKVRVQGQLVSPATKRLIGVVPQANLLYRHLTCQENLHFFARLYGLSASDRARYIPACLEMVGLTEQAKTPASKLNDALQKRLSLAIALVHQPKLLLLDEPTHGLDIQTREQIWEIIRQLHRQGLTLLLTTTQPQEAEALCERIGILQRGQLLAEGTQAELRQRVAAAMIAIIDTPDEAAAIDRARALGFPLRRYDGRLGCWLPQVFTLPDIFGCFQEISLQSIELHPVDLQFIYSEVTQGTPKEFFIPQEIPDPWNEEMGAIATAEFAVQSEVEGG
jgi:ABC-2 type transport system ATP-binding protein